MKYNCVPTCFNTGFIIPIPKKATLDSNRPEHCHHITLSSIQSKLFESFIMPDVTLNNNQFGFRKGYRTSFGIDLLNDFLCQSKYSKTPMFIYSLDDDNLFDSIWHNNGLFYKLQSCFPDVLWRFFWV